MYLLIGFYVWYIFGLIGAFSIVMNRSRKFTVGKLLLVVSFAILGAFPFMVAVIETEIMENVPILKIPRKILDKILNYEIYTFK